MYIEAALKGKNQFWRYLVSVFLFIVAYIVGQIPLTIVILKKNYGDASEFVRRLDFEILGIHPLTGFVLLIIPFIVVFFTIILSVTALHERSFKSLLTGNVTFRWKKVFFAAGIMLLLLLANELVFYYLQPDNYSVNASCQEVLPLAALALIILPFQTSAEEFLLRGYLVQGLGLFFKFGFIAVVLTSAIFGLLHFQNPEVDELGLGLAMVYYMGFGLFMGILVLMSEGLELSLGVHFIINFYSIVFLTYPGSAVKTPALFRINELDPEMMILSFLATAILFLVIVSIRYKWKNWGKLFSKVEIPVDIQNEQSQQ